MLGQAHRQRLDLGQARRIVPAISLTSFKDRNLFAASQAGLVNNLNDGHELGDLPAILCGVWARRGADRALEGDLSCDLGRAAGGDRAAERSLGTQRAHRRRHVGAGGGLFLTAATTNSAGGLSAVCSWAPVPAMVYPSLIAAVSNASHPAWRARSLSVYRFWRDLGYAIGALEAGIIADLLGLSWAIGTIAALAFVSGAVVAVAMKPAVPASGQQACVRRLDRAQTGAVRHAARIEYAWSHHGIGVLHRRRNGSMVFCSVGANG